MCTPTPPALQMVGITKRFPGGVVANDTVTLCARAGGIHAVIGENGAGKSTAMNILYGRIRPDSGQVLLDGEPVTFSGPGDAIRRGIGMVTQHTTMIPALSVEENIALGFEMTRFGALDRGAARSRILEICRRLSVEIDPMAPAESLSVAALQKAEIAKALYRGARILILDEPTACLAPQEADALFRVMRDLASDGATLLLVTHKLPEVMAHCADVTVLRAGRTVLETRTADTSTDDLVAAMMPGLAHSGPASPAPPAKPPERPALEVIDLTAFPDRRGPALHDLSLTVAEGEIVGVAGVDGSGQQELADAIVGTGPIQAGQVRLNGVDCTRRQVAWRLRQGLAYIPQDRHREGLVLEFPVWENLLLGRQRDPAAGGGTILNLPQARRSATVALRDHDIRAGSIDESAGSLSGGNQQKLLMARATSLQPRLVVAMQPTRGLDLAATQAAYDRLRALAAADAGVLVFSLDLDEILAVSQRVAVMYQGTVVTTMPTTEADANLLGSWMLTGRPPASPTA